MTATAAAPPSTRPQLDPPHSLSDPLGPGGAAVGVIAALFTYVVAAVAIVIGAALMPAGTASLVYSAAVFCITDCPCAAAMVDCDDVTICCAAVADSDVFDATV